MAESCRFGKIEVGNIDHSDSSRSLKQRPSATSSIILVITRNPHLAEPVMDYTLNLARRLNCRVLAAYVDTLPHRWDAGQRSRLFLTAASENAAVYNGKAVAKGVELAYVRESGKISKVLSRLCRIVKRVEFVVVDKGIKIEDALSRVPVPVFNIFYDACTQSDSNEQYASKLFLQRISK